MKGSVIGNDRGVSILFLVVALMVMVLVGYGFSYLIQGSHRVLPLVVGSNQAFFLAQSGVEFAVRYAADNGIGSLSVPVTRDLGRGRFTITYEPVPVDRLTSEGVVPGIGRRTVIISNFTRFLSHEEGLILWVEPPVYTGPCWVNPRTNVRFYIKNIGGSVIVLDSFSATWGTPPVRSLTTILMDGVTKFSGSYSPGSGVRRFTPAGNTQVINPGLVVVVNLVWAGNINPGASITVSFYEPGGRGYSFNLGVPALGC